MKRVCLRAMLASICMIILGLACAVIYARRIESGTIHSLASLEFEQKNQGSALQEEAFRQANLLPFYGSSELWVSQAEYTHPTVLFYSYPMGFRVFPVGKAGNSCLLILQKLAAIGPGLKGKKVVISLSPRWFLESEGADPQSYAGNFSRLHAGAAVFSTSLGFSLKQRIARRMLDFPETVQGDPILKFAMERLAGGSTVDRALYYASMPVGKLWNLVVRLQDHWETFCFIRSQPDLQPDARAHARNYDWISLRDGAAASYQSISDNNPFGIYNNLWIKTFRAEAATAKNSLTDSQFLENLRQTEEWQDFDLLLSTLRQMGAEPLLLCMPLKGPYFDYIGISGSARSAFYRMLEDKVKPYGFPLVDFSDHDEDKYFLFDRNHLSGKGWVYYDRAMDAYFHDATGAALDLDKPESLAQAASEQTSQAADDESRALPVLQNSGTSPGTVVAIPNPVPPGDGMGRTTIHWNTGTSAPGQLYLVVPGVQDRLVGEGTSGTFDAPWISAGGLYEFALYAGTNYKDLVGSVTVTRLSSAESAASSAEPAASSAEPAASSPSPGASRPQPAPLLIATPNPVPVGADEGAADIKWDTGDGSVGQLYLVVAGYPDRLVGQDVNGTYHAPWISAGGVYQFQLYAGTDHKNLLASVSVTGVRGAGPVAPATPPKDSAPAQPSGQPLLTATPNPVPPGDGPGVSDIKWDTGDGSMGQLYLVVIGTPDRRLAEGTSGTYHAPWISAGGVYRFALYAGTDRRKLLLSIAVTRPRK